MITPDQWIMPFNIMNGSTRVPMQPSTDEDLDKLPYMIATRDDIWDPTVLDCLIDVAMDSNIDEEDLTSFDECTSMTGSYLHHDSYGHL